MNEIELQYISTNSSNSHMQFFMHYCEQQSGLKFINYVAFDQFAVTQFRTFWRLFLQWSKLIFEGETEPVCLGDDVETATFFPHVSLNYTENLLNSDDGTLISCHTDDNQTVSRAELRQQVISLALALRRFGITPGDRVVAVARNNIEVVVAALASAAIGATFSSCAHDMGAFSILARFERLQPKLLFVNLRGRAWDTGESLTNRMAEVTAGLPSLRDVINLDDDDQSPRVIANVAVHRLYDLLNFSADGFVWQRFPFNHPLFIMFSSGTTGLPKCIVHSAGGTLIEHVKEHRLHGDLGSQDIMFFQTSCGWMMWNWQLSALACGASIVLYDGPLDAPNTLWRLVFQQRVTVFGTNPAYLQFTERADYSPRLHFDFTALRSVLSTGSILYPKQFDWVVEHVKHIPVQSISGGTDIIGCFVLGNPLLPVYRGKAQCRSLGLDVRSIPERIGDLICANPFPSRPLGFYGEDGGQRYHDAYFSQHAGVWTHGDQIEITPHGITMLGRSDGVLNIRGVRIGPAEIYRILQQIPPILEAMAVEQIDENEPGGARLVLLLVLRAGIVLDTSLIFRIRHLLAEQGNLMMVPAAIIAVAELPITHSGKRSETAARDAINGLPIRNRTALLNPECLDGLTVTRRSKHPSSLVAMDADDLERRLCEICERNLNVPKVIPSDNFRNMGGDSLAILGFLMEVIERTKTTRAVQTLIGISTIRNLASALRGEIIEPPLDRALPMVRAMRPEDEDAIGRLLDEGFQPPSPMDWNQIFHHPWQDKRIPHGFVLTVNNEIVGFLGLICAEREINGRTVNICNLTSWYVRKQYRGWSTALLAAGTQYDDLTYTSLTPMAMSRPILSAVGFSRFDGIKLFLPPLLHLASLHNPAPLMVFGAAVEHLVLSKQQRKIITDHAHYKCLPLALITATETALMIARRRRRKMFGRLLPFSELLYCSSPELLIRHLERIKLAVMRRQRTFGLAVSQQMFSQQRPPWGVKIDSVTLFRSTTLAAHELDKLYSELILLPL